MPALAAEVGALAVLEHHYFLGAVLVDDCHFDLRTAHTGLTDHRLVAIADQQDIINHKGVIDCVGQPLNIHNLTRLYAILAVAGANHCIHQFKLQSSLAAAQLLNCTGKIGENTKIRL
jgi:hypothetical protein